MKMRITHLFHSPQRSLLGLVLLTAGLFYFHNSSPGVVGTFQDDGVYVVTAKALAEGHGYKIISMPDPLPQTKYPIVYPFLLSLIWKAFPHFPQNLFPMKVFSMVSAIAFFGLAYVFLTSFASVSKNLAVGIVAMAALNPYTICFSAMVMSEMPYAFLSLVTLFLLRRYEDKAERVWLSLFAVACAAALCYLTRSIGIAILLSCFLYLVSRRQVKKAFLFSAVALIVISPWLIWVGMNSSPLQSKVEIHGTSYTRWFLDYTGQLNLTNVVNIVFANLIYSVGDIGAYLNPLVAYVPIFRPIELAAGLPCLIGFLALLGAALAFLLWMRHHGYDLTALDFYILIYLLIVMIWPWPPWRFFVPIAPFILMYAFRLVSRGSALVAGLISRPSQSNIVRHVVLIFVLANMALTVALDLIALRETRHYGWLTTPYISHPPYKWKEMENLFTQVRDHTPSDATLGSIYDSLFYLYTGRKTISCYSFDPLQTFYKPHASSTSSTSPEEIVTSLQKHRIDYLIFLPGSEALTIGNHLKEFRRTNPGLLLLSYKSPDKQLFIFKVDAYLAKQSAAKILEAH